MADVKQTETNKAIGLVITFILVLGAIGTFTWQYDRDYSKLYDGNTLIARERFSVEMNRIYSTIKYDYQEDNCLEAGGRLTNTRCYYPQNYYLKLNRNLKNTEVSNTEYSDFYLTTRNTDFYKYGTKGTVAGSLVQEYKHLKDVTDIKEFPVEYMTTFTPNDNTKYRMTWEVDKLKDITLPDGKYTDCKYEFGKILIDLKDNCDDLEYAEVVNSKDKINFHFKPSTGVQYYNLKLVDPPLVNDTDTFPHIFINESMVYVKTELGSMLNITDSSTDVGVRTIGPKQYEWFYIYTYQGESYHPKIKLDCNTNHTYDNGTYVCGDITVDMSTPTKVVNISDYNSSTVATVLDQPQQIKFNMPDYDNESGEFTYTLHTDYNNFRTGDKIVLDPTITIAEADVFENSSYVDMRGEGNQFSHLDLEDDDLVLYMPFDDDTGSTTYDYSVNDNDGGIVGSTFTSGYINNAYRYPGLINNYINLPYEQLRFNGQNDFTVCLWSKIPITPLPDAGDAFIDARDGNDDGWRIVLGGNGNPIFSINTIDSTNNGFLINDNEFHHLCGVADFNGNAILYVDKNIIDSKDITGQTISISADITIATQSDTNSAYLNGTVDEVMIFNRSLNASEISEIYNNQSARFTQQGTQTVRFQNITKGSDKVNVTIDDFNINGGTIETRVNYWKPSMGYNDTDSGLVGAWHLDGDATDSSGNGNDGTVSGATVTDGGIFDKGYDFDGTGTQEISTSLVMSQISGDFSFGGWFNRFDDSSSAILDYLIGFDSGGADRLYLSTTISGTNNIKVGLFDWNPEIIIGFNDNVWNNYYIVYDNETNNGYIYFNSELVGNQSNIIRTNTVNSFNIGRLSSSGINGTIDEARVYNRSLSATEVKDLYIKGSLKYANTEYETLSLVNSTRATNEFLITNDTEIIQSEYRVTSDSTRFLSPTVRASQGLIYNLFNTDPLNVTLCPDLGGALNYTLDSGYYNPTTGYLVQTGILPTNYALCGYTHEVDNNATSTKDIYAYLNATDSRFIVKINDIAIGDTPTLIFSALASGSSIMTTETLDANISLVNATQAYNYNLAIIGD